MAAVDAVRRSIVQLSRVADPQRNGWDTTMEGTMHSAQRLAALVLLVIACLGAMGTPAAAAKKPTVAVLDFAVSASGNDATVGGRDVADCIFNGLVDGGWRVIERRKLDSVLTRDEMAPGSDPPADRLRKVAAILGVDYVLVGEVTADRGVSLSARLIDPRRSEIVVAAGSSTVRIAGLGLRRTMTSEQACAALTSNLLKRAADYGLIQSSGGAMATAPSGDASAGPSRPPVRLGQSAPPESAPPAGLRSLGRPAAATAPSRQQCVDAQVSEFMQEARKQSALLGPGGAAFLEDAERTMRQTAEAACTSDAAFDAEVQRQRQDLQRQADALSNPAGQETRRPGAGVGLGAGAARGGSCRPTLAHLASRLPQFAQSDLASLREQLLATRMDDVERDVLARGIRLSDAAGYMLAQGKEYEQSKSQSKECVIQDFDGDGRAVAAALDGRRYDAAITTLHGDRTSVREMAATDGLLGPCIRAYLAADMGRIVNEEEAVQLTCRAAAR